MSGVIASIGIGLGTTAMSFAQYMNQNKLQKEAQADAERAMAAAKMRLEMNVFEKLGIAKLPYAQARESALVQGAMATEAARESERGAAAAAGRVQMAQQEQQADIAAKQEQEILNLNKLVATEEGRLLDVGTQLNLEEVAGAQQAASDAQIAKNQALQQGIQGLGNIAQTAIQAAPLYGKSRAVKQEGDLREKYNAAIEEQKRAGYKRMNPEFLDDKGNPIPFQQALSKMEGAGGWNFAGVGTMKPEEYQNWLLTQKGSTFKKLGETNNFLMPKAFFYPTTD